MPTQAMQIVVVLALLTTGVEAYRKKRSSTVPAEGQQVEQKQSMESSLRERSSQTQSFVESKQLALDDAVMAKGSRRRDDRRRDSRRRHSRNGWCLPHQQCTWNDCCSLGTSCNTCPGGHHGEVAFGRCALKGHFVCNTRDCQGSWGAWSGCSQECGGGTTESVYEVVHEASSGGRACPATRVQTQACNAQPCPVDCIGSWGNFGPCSETCGGGGQSQTYTVSTAAQHGGNTCPHQHGETRDQVCGTQPCPVDCEGQWGQYGECSATCGDGAQTRQYTVSSPNQHGGTPCPNNNGQTQSQACKTQECPVDCQGQWGEYGICSATCGSGTQTRIYTVSATEQHAGASCPSRDGQMESQACQTQECPYNIIGDGKCLSCGQDPLYEYKHGQGPQCEHMCEENDSCCAYSTSGHDNCLLWTQCEGLTAGGDDWGGAKCHVKHGFEDLACPTPIPTAIPTTPCPEDSFYDFKRSECRDTGTGVKVLDGCCN